MLHWSMLGELYSLLVLLILYIRYYMYERNWIMDSKLRVFTTCLQLSMGFIVLNLLCVWGLNNPSLIPRWVNQGLNSLYFLGAIHLCSLYAYVIFQGMLEHVYDKHCLVRAQKVLIAVTAVAYILVIYNGFTGILFLIDAEGIYHRGPWNRVFYLLMLLELVFVMICFVRNRASVGDRMVYVVRSVPPIVVLLCVLQVLFPQILLNGTICATVSLLIFVSFRSYTESRDSLTGAGSRKAFLHELTLRSGTSQSVQFLQIALLNIADVNLRYSHKAGDDLIYEIAQFLRHFDPGVQVFRTGNTTFTVALPYENDEAADARLQTIQSQLRKEWVLGDLRCQLVFAIADLRTASLCGHPGQIMERLEYTTALAKADPPYVRFDDAVEEQLERRDSLVALMRRSIDEKRFRVVYQPVYCCHRDLFCSAEALLRLDDEEGKSVNPEVFIPLAEDTGMIGELTWIVLEDICGVLSSETLPGLESVSMNLSMKQFLDPSLPGQVKECLDRHGISASRLKVEITERFILHDAAYAKKQMEKLKELGIQIYMDDFGTGYSNLSSVLHFPFAFIKLDRSLTATVLEDNMAAIMASTLLGLFHEMGKRVIIEGVEREEQAQYLRSVGADMIQGFYYARPTDPNSLRDYFAR